MSCTLISIQISSCVENHTAVLFVQWVMHKIMVQVYMSACCLTIFGWYGHPCHKECLYTCACSNRSCAIFRVWIPGPEDFDWKKVYLYFWFIYLQDVMERAVLQEILNKTVVTPGTYINEMSYPCYDLD